MPIYKVQRADEVVDLSTWKPDQEYKIFPLGTREKSAYIAPNNIALPFLIPRHRYLLKLSVQRYPIEFWSEIIAYRIGCFMGLPTPPSFVAINSSTGQLGALIEWFYGLPGQGDQRVVWGGDYMVRFITDYDRKRGREHNFEHISAFHKVLVKRRLMTQDWIDMWGKILLFDALIGNTDRHQDNWGIIWTIHVDELISADQKPRYDFKVSAVLTPAFDNGSSLGREILDIKLEDFQNVDHLRRYIQRGTHHMKWSRLDDRKCGHAELISKYVGQYPDVKDILRKSINFNFASMTKAILELTEFNVAIPLSKQRAEFIVKLTEMRRDSLSNLLRG